MTVALGTSTPTSMTVVHTSTSISPARNAGHRGVLLVGGQPPVHEPQPQVGQLPGTQPGEQPFGGRRRCRPPCLVRCRRSRRSGAPPHRPGARAATSSMMRCQARSSHAGLSVTKITLLVIGWRPRGSSRSVEVSRSPYTVSATVRGIGVAVITSRCGVTPAGALARNWSRCSTPNRCCSSTTTMPRLWNSTASCSSAWVPMTMPTWPPAISARTCFFCGRPSSSRSAAPPGWRCRRRPAGPPSPTGRAHR